MAMFQGLIFLLLGVGLLLMVWRSLDCGWLPFGTNGFKGRFQVFRSEHPLWYWAAFVLYSLGGLWLLIYALRLMTGAAEPLPLN